MSEAQEMDVSVKIEKEEAMETSNGENGVPTTEEYQKLTEAGLTPAVAKALDAIFQEGMLTLKSKSKVCD